VALLVDPPPARALLASPALTSADEGVRLAAVAALGRTTDAPDAVAAALLSALASDGEAGVRAAAAGALGGVDPPAAADDAATAAAAGGGGGGPAAGAGPGLTPAVRAGLRAAAAGGGGDPHFMVRYSALVSLGTGRAVGDVPFLLSVLDGCAKADPNDQLVAQGAVMALAEMRLARGGAAAGGDAATAWVPDAVAALAAWAAVPDGLTRMAVARALGVAATSWGAAAVAGGVLRGMREGEGPDVRAVVGGVLERVAAARRAAEGEA